jgi:hypothetical protein
MPASQPPKTLGAEAVVGDGKSVPLIRTRRQLNQDTVLSSGNEVIFQMAIEVGKQFKAHHDQKQDYASPAPMEGVKKRG